MLIGVTAHAVEFLEVDQPRPVVLYELVKGWLTGSEPDLGEMHEVKKLAAAKRKLIRRGWMALPLHWRYCHAGSCATDFTN